MKNKVSKEVKKRNFYLTIINSIKNHGKLSKVMEEIDISKQNLNYYTKELRRNNAIFKIGYGVWAINEKEVKKFLDSFKVCPSALSENKSGFFNPMACRGHDYQFTLKLKRKLRNWDCREKILNKKGIAFKRIHFQKNQSLRFEGIRVWLCKESIVIHYPKDKSHFGRNANQCFIETNNDFIGFITRLEKYLMADFKIRGKYQYKTTRSHYGLIKNCFARRYIDNNKRIGIRDDAGTLWMIVDNSEPNLVELEFVNSEEDDRGMTKNVWDEKKVNNFFNNLVEGYTPKFVLKALGDITKNQEYYADNMRSHVKAVKDLGNGVRELVKVVKELKKEKQ